jgi:hypothetical protein
VYIQNIYYISICLHVCVCVCVCYSVSINMYELFCRCHECSLFLGATAAAAAAAAAAAVADHTTGRGGTHATHTRRLVFARCHSVSSVVRSRSVLRARVLSTTSSSSSLRLAHTLPSTVVL